MGGLLIMEGFRKKLCSALCFCYSKSRLFVYKKDLSMHYQEYFLTISLLFSGTVACVNHEEGPVNRNYSPTGAAYSPTQQQILRAAAAVPAYFLKERRKRQR